jgi:hypothetical protein
MCGNLEFDIHVEFPYMHGVALDSRFDYDERRFDCRYTGYKAPRAMIFFLNVNQMSTPASARRRPRNNTNEPPALRHRSARGRVAVRRVANNNNMMAGLNQYGTMMPQRLVYGNNNAANNNWQKPGAPRVIRTLPYTARRAFRNDVALHNFNSGNIGYLMFRGNVPVLYTAESLYGLIKAGPRKRHINSVNNLNHFLARVKNNKELFKNTGTRRPRTQRNIRKVKVSMNRAARVIQKKFRATRQ